MTEPKFNASDYALECWSEELGGLPVREVAHADYSECYETDAMHVFELRDGRFAFVRESGCSCYCYDDADISIYGSEQEAMEEFNERIR